MNIFADIRALIITALRQISAPIAPLDKQTLTAVVCEPPRDSAHGHMATNAALIAAKPLQRPPGDIANAVIPLLEQDARIDSAVAAGPGFINITLKDSAWHSVLTAILAEQNTYGHSPLGQGENVNVEYVSANPTGPLHIGHARGAVFGDSLANILSFMGYNVTREYYVNDAGAQVDSLARSVYLRYLQAAGHTINTDTADYSGDYMIPLGQQLYAVHKERYINETESSWLAPFRDFSINAMLDMIKADLLQLNVHMDVFFSERSLHSTNSIQAALDDLANKGYIYRGTLPPPKGKLPTDWRARTQTLFAATKAGDDTDRPVQKANGEWTYFASDIAYHYDKIKRGYTRLINVFGADHAGYIKRMQAVVAALSNNQVDLSIRVTQLVRLFEQGVPLKMSKRTGHFVTLRQVCTRVGTDAVRFAMLTRKNDAPLDFDFNKVVEQSKDNPVFYVQYASARIHSVLRRAAECGLPTDAGALTTQADFATLTDTAQQDIIRKLAEWPQLLMTSAQHCEPHRVAFYLYECAGCFHALWNKGNSNPAVRFIHTEGDVHSPAHQAAQLALLYAVGCVLTCGLRLLGITAAKRM